MSAHRCRGRGPGQSLVEFSLVLPILVLMFMGVVDFGRGILAYNQVQNAAREAARTGIVDQNVSDIAVKAAREAYGLGLPTTISSNCPAPDGPTSDASGTCVSFLHDDLTTTCAPMAVGCVVDVSVRFTFTPLTPIVGNIVGSLSLVGVSRQAVENVCSTGCQPR